MKNKIVDIYEENGRKIYKGTGIFEGDSLTNLRDLVRRSRDKYGDKIAFKFKRIYLHKASIA